MKISNETPVREQSAKQLVAVLAGTYEQFEHWCAEHPKECCVYCDEWPRFAGLRFVRMVEVGTFRQRNDAVELWKKVVARMQHK